MVEQKTMSEANLFVKLEEEVLGSSSPTTPATTPNKNVQSWNTINFFKRKILKQKMDQENRTRAAGQPIERRTKSTSGLTADDFCSSNSTLSRRSYHHKEPLNDSKMGNGTSKRRGSEDRGRKQRSAAERLVDSRKSARNNAKTNTSSMPKRSRSVGDRLATETDRNDYQKSMENIPVEIREQFNPAFAQELNRLVRQKSKKREETGFQDPNDRSIHEDDFTGKLNTLSRKSDMQQTTRRGSVSNTLGRIKTKSQEHLSNETTKNRSAYEALYSNSGTINRAVPGKPPRSKSTSNYLDIKANEDKLASEVSFAGTNNSSLRFPSETSQESIYDNVQPNPPSKRTDQPPPSKKSAKIENTQQNLSKDLKTATMMLRNRYTNNTTRTLPKSRQNSTGNNLNETLQKRINSTLPMKPVTTDNDSGRLFMMSGKEPLLHCRNTACSNSASLEYAQQNYKSCVHCFTYYCCAACRQQHWQKHKEKCIYARAVSTTKAILRYIFQNTDLMEHYTELARNYTKTEQRGALQLCFMTLNDGLMFLQAR